MVPLVTWHKEGEGWSLSVETSAEGWLWVARCGMKYSTGYCASEELAIECGEHALGLSGPCSERFGVL